MQGVAIVCVDRYSNWKVTGAGAKVLDDAGHRGNYSRYAQRSTNGKAYGITGDKERRAVSPEGLRLAPGGGGGVENGLRTFPRKI